LFALLEPHLASSDSLDHKAMLSVKHTGKQEVAKPPKFSSGSGHQNSGTKGHAFGSTWFNTHFKPRPLLQDSMYGPDKRIPVRIGCEISKDSPDAAWHRINFYFCIDLMTAYKIPFSLLCLTLRFSGEPCSGSSAVTGCWAAYGHCHSLARLRS